MIIPELSITGLQGNQVWSTSMFARKHLLNKNLEVLLKISQFYNSTLWYRSILFYYGYFVEDKNHSILDCSQLPKTLWDKKRIYRCLSLVYDALLKKKEKAKVSPCPTSAHTVFEEAYGE